VNRKIFTLGAVGSVALHVWLIWPARPAPPAAVATAEPETKRVAVREVDANLLRQHQRKPDPATPEASPSAPDAPEPIEVAAAPASAAVTSPAAVPPAVAPSELASPPAAVPVSAPSPVPAAAGPIGATAVDAGNAPAMVHAPLPRRDPVIESAPQPLSEQMASQVERFEAQAAQLARSAPAVPTASQQAVSRPAASSRREIPPVEFMPRSAPPAPTSPAFPWLKRKAAPVELAGFATPAAAPPAAASQPIGPIPVRRDPVPYRPVRFGGGSGSNRREVSAAFAEAVDRGAISAMTQVPQEPVARIAWGSADEALRLLELGRMALVTVDEGLKIVGGIEPAAGSWRRSASLPSLAPYSNRVRVVDHVAGFAAQATLCGPGEHLAVVVPVGLERRIEKAMDDAARQEGLPRTSVAACYGRLVAGPSGLEFRIERVERRNGT